MAKARKLRGRQEPSFSVVPKHTGSEGGLACDLADGYGMTPDPWQRTVMVGWLATLAGGRWAASDCGISVPRQNGKNGIMEFLELYLAAILGLKILHTAHEVKTCRKHFLRMKAYFENERKYPEMAALVDTIRQTNGQEAIILTNGGSIEFIARSKSSGRGFTVDVLVCDEAQELTDEQMEAIQPAISSAPSGNPLTIYAGTPTPPGSPGTVFARIRKEAHSGDSRRLCWFEWSASEIGDVNDRSRWEATNPALGIRLMVDVIESEAKKFTADGFARERLGWWSEESELEVISVEQWHATECAEPQADGLMGFGVDMPPDRSALAISYAFKHDDGTAFIGLQEYRDVKQHGTAWAVDWLAERWPKTASVVVDAMSPAMALVPDLQKRHVRVTVTSSNELGQATGRMLDMIRAGQVTHLPDDQQPQLALAAKGVMLRDIGPNGAVAWNKKGSDVEISPLQAATLALYGVFTTKRRPGRKQHVAH